MQAARSSVLLPPMLGPVSSSARGTAAAAPSISPPPATAEAPGHAAPGSAAPPPATTAGVPRARSLGTGAWPEAVVAQGCQSEAKSRKAPEPWSRGTRQGRQVGPSAVCKHTLGFRVRV